MNRFVGAAAAAALTAVAALTVTSANALVRVYPVSYHFSQPTACGSWCYHDPNFSKLTDGAVGNIGWAVNQGQEWDGWYNTPQVDVIFDFGTAKHVDIARVGTTQDNLGDVVLPRLHFFFSNDGQAFVQTGGNITGASAANDHSAFDTGALHLTQVAGLASDSRYIKLSALANGPWTFLSEVEFYRLGSAVPEPASWATMLLGLAGLGGAARARRRAATTAA